jgi:hypothetical protein
MNTKLPLATAVIASAILFACAVSAADIVATGSGDWESTVPDAPWTNGIVPGAGDSADIEAPFVVTVESNAAAAYVYGSGTVVMAANAVLDIDDPLGANGTYQLATLDTGSSGNTVVYSSNPFWAKHQNYYNLVFSNTVTTNMIDFYNGTVNSQDPAAAMTISGDMTIVGKIKVQEGDDFTILGNLTLQSNAQWDCSSFNVTVSSNTTVGAGALLLDLDGALGSNYFMGSVTIASNAIGWNVSDVTQWTIGGSLTNQGLIVGHGYGSVDFAGTGVITGKPFTLPTISVSGNYLIGTTITLTTNTPTLLGTIIFDLANTNQLVLKSYPTNALTLYYSGNLDVINSGPAPAPGTTYKLFSATNYGGGFTTETLPPLSAGLSWSDNLLTSGSITVSGSAPTPPSITSAQYNPATQQFTLTWNSQPSVTYSVQYSSNLATDYFTNHILATGIPSGGTVTMTTVTLPAGNKGFLRVSQP